MYANVFDLIQTQIEMNKNKEELEKYSSVISFENSKGGVVDELNEINKELELLKLEVVEIYSELGRIFREMHQEIMQTDANSSIRFLELGRLYLSIIKHR